MEKANHVIDIYKAQNNETPIDVLKKITSNQDLGQDPFYLVNLNDIYDKYYDWTSKLPRVTPHYAVKCNSDIAMLKLLAYLGASFDCASKVEIQTVIDIGVTPDRIIYANPCKQISYIEFARQRNVNCMTFDNEDELYKIKETYPDARIVLRIITDDRNALSKFSLKFGADMKTSYKLIDLAFKLNLNLIGISFHVGSRQMSTNAFEEPIKNARELFNYTEKAHGKKLTLLDIGGGFPGLSEVTTLFDLIAESINTSLDTHFPNKDEVRVIAEPGRYFPFSAFTLCVNVIARRVVDNESGKSFLYYVNDGIFTSFNCIIYDHVEDFPPYLLKDSYNNQSKYKAIIFGPTCDGMDVIMRDCELPELQIGDYIVFKNMGSYTIVASTPFNGIPLPVFRYMVSKSYWRKIKHAFD